MVLIENSGKGWDMLEGIKKRIVLFKSKHFGSHQILVILFFSLITVFIVGCTTTKYTTSGENRHWDLEYNEALQVMTEPQGAKVYVEGSTTNYIGISPAKINLTGVGLRARQYGTYRQQYLYDSFSATSSGYRRLGATTWRDKLDWQILEPGHWVIKAYKDGYRPAEKKHVINNTNRIVSAAGNLKVSSSGNLPNLITGNNSILITLEPLPTYPNKQKNEKQQQQQQTVVIPGNQQGETPIVGKVMVSSNIQGAEVYVDGAFVGNVPANLKLESGIHIIEVKKQGYSSYRKELRVLGGSELSLRAELHN